MLPKLTVEDLKEIGVTRVGDRRKLLEAIATLREGGPPLPVAATSAVALVAVLAAGCCGIDEMAR